MVALEGGWIRTAYTGHELAPVEIGVGPQPGAWRSAFLDYADDGTRVAQVRPPADVHGNVIVWLSCNGHVTRVGRLTL